MKILNIHGYHGSCENSACSALRELGHNVISPQLDYDASSPSEIISMLLDIIEMEAPDRIVGTSLGGFFALCLSAERDMPCVLVNPCLCPFVTLAELGYNGDLTPFMTLLGSFCTDIKQDKTTALIGGADEVISYHSLTRKLIHDHTVIPGGKHSGATLDLPYHFRKLIK